MERYDEVRLAILDLLREIGLQPDKALSIYEIGIPLVPKGFTQDELANALIALESAKIITLLPNNALRLILPLD